MNKKRKIFPLLLLAAIFYGCLAIFGVREYGDSGTYREMRSFRDPLYGLIINGLESAFGSTGDWILGFFQNTLAIVSIYLLFTYIIKNVPVGVFAQVGIFIALIAPFVITPFLTSSRFIISNAVMTEGMVLPLYDFLTFLFLHLLWEDQEKEGKERSIFALIVITLFVMNLLRGQMKVTLIVWLLLEIVLVVKSWKRKTRKHGLIRFLTVLLSLVMLLGLSKQIIGYTNLKYNEAKIQTTYGKLTFFTNLVYSSDEQSIACVEDETLRELYREIYTRCEEEKLLHQYAPEDFTEEAEFFSASHDRIKMEIAQEVFLEYCFVNYPTKNYAQDFVEMDRMAGEISRDIFSNCFPKWISNVCKNVWVGLVRSVAFTHKYLYLPIFLGYIGLIAMAIISYKRMGKTRVLQFFLLVILMTAGTVSSISLLIMCLSRYMIYNMSLIYVVGILMADQLFQKK